MGYHLGRALDRYFHITDQDSSLAQEIRAGFTTFMAMAYILFINPQILGHAIPLAHNGFGQLLIATALTSALGSLLMGVLARYPFALAPGMGLNAYFTYSVVINHQMPWQIALGSVFLSGIAMLILTVSGVRRAIIDSLPETIKTAISAGVGLFLTLIGAKNCGLVEGDPSTLLRMGTIPSAELALALSGLVLTVVLLHRRIHGAMVIGIVLMTLVAIILELPVYDNHQAFAGISGGLWQAPAWPVDLIGALDIKGALNWGALAILFTFTMVDIFDTAGTLIGLSQLPSFKRQGAAPLRSTQVFAADALATSVGALLGTSTVTTYVESATGMEEGGRTGLTAVVVGLLFLLSVFFWPLAQAVPVAASAPALMIVGFLMMGNLAVIPWAQLLEAFPAFITIVMIPFSFSVADGISAGVFAHIALNLGVGRWRNISPFLYCVGSALLLRFFYLSLA